MHLEVAASLQIHASSCAGTPCDALEALGTSSEWRRLFRPDRKNSVVWIVYEVIPIRTTCRAHCDFEAMAPFESYSILVPMSDFAFRVVTLSLLKASPKILAFNETWRLITGRLFSTNPKAQSELRASPRKPNVSTPGRSQNSLSFDVWCFRAEKKRHSDLLADMCRVRKNRVF